MFHNISNPKWFGNWSRLEDDYLGNGGTDGTSPLSVDPEAGRRPSMISGTVSLRVATTFPWRATTAHPAGTRSRRMHLQGMRPERMTRTSDRTRSDKK